MISKIDRSMVGADEERASSSTQSSEPIFDQNFGKQNAWIEGWMDSANHLAESFDADCAFIIELPQAMNLTVNARYVCSCGHLKNCKGHLLDDPLVLETIRKSKVAYGDAPLYDHPYNQIIPKSDQSSFLAVSTRSRLNGSRYVFGLIGRQSWSDPDRTLKRLEGMAYFASQILCSKTDALEADLFFQLAQDAIMRVSSDGTIVKINQVAEKITGYKNSELGHQSLSTIFPGLQPSDLLRMSYECQLNAQLSPTKTCENMVKIQTKAGKLHLVDLSISGYIPNHSGNNDFVVILRDRSEHQKLETMVKQVSDFSNEILSIVGAYVFVIDHHGKIVRFNHECERFTGELFEEVVGQLLWDVIPEAQSHRKQLERYKKNPDHFIAPSTHKTTWTDKEKSKHHIQWRNSIIKDKQKKLKYLIACGVDVTEQDTSRKIILRDGKLLQQFIHYAPAAVAMFDTKFNYLEASLRWKGKFNIPEEENCAGTNPMIRHENLSIFENWRVAVHECLNGHHKKSSRDTFTKPDGQEEIIRWEMQPWYDEESLPGGVIVFAEIITELIESEKSKRSLERQLYRAQKLEAIGTLAGGVAHDFNNILAGIVGFTEILKLEFSENKFASELTDEVLRATDRAKMLVKQILAFSRNQEQTKSPASLKPIIKEVAKMMKATCPSHIKVKADTIGDIPFVLCDQNQIHQVVVNLCTNAIHAMEDLVSGKLNVQLECIQIEKEEADTIHKMKIGSYVKLTIKDTGEGMDDATMQRIFDPFFTTKEAGRGTGLGLSVVHGIIKSHDGHIKVISKKGKGSRFDIYLPAMEDAQAAEKNDHISSLPLGNGQRILFVDNEASICQSSQMGLEKSGYVIESFVDPCLAIQRFWESPDSFDILITDLDMPRITGIDLARKIKSDHPEFPIILCSGFISEKLKQSTDMNLFDHVLAKPNKLFDLCHALDSIFNKNDSFIKSGAKENVKVSD